MSEGSSREPVVLLPLGVSHLTDTLNLLNYCISSPLLSASSALRASEAESARRSAHPFSHTTFAVFAQP